MYTRTPNSPIKRNSLKTSDTLPVFVDVVGVSDIVFVGVGFKPIYKGFSFQGGQSVVLAPLGIHSVKRGGADRRAITNDSRFCKKIDDISVLRNRLGEIRPCFLAYRKPKIILDKPPQTVQHPAKYPFLFGYEFIRKERVVLAAWRFRLG